MRLERIARNALGIVSGAAEIAGFVQSQLGPEAWTIMRGWHGEAVHHGLAAREPSTDFILGVLERAKGALLLILDTGKL